MIYPTPDLDLPPDHLLRQLIDAIAAHPEVREPLLRVLLTEDFLALPRQMTEVQEQLGKLQASFEESKEENREEFRAVREEIRAVRTELGENTRVTRTLAGHVGRLRGHSYEDRCQQEIGVILDGWLDDPVPARREEIRARLRQARQNNAITRDEYLDGLRPDIIAHEGDDLSQTRRLAVVEASITFNQSDLENAARRAAVIAKVTSINTAAFVATHSEWPDAVNAVAQQLGVTIIRHDSPDHAPEPEAEPQPAQ